MSFLQTAITTTPNPLHKSSTLFLILLFTYLLSVRLLRNKRAENIKSAFSNGKRPLSSMTTEEAHTIITQLQELEFPYAFNKARKISLLKAGGIPSMSKLFAATGRNNRRNSSKRAIDTEILLREVQTKERESTRYMQSIARMNYFHLRYRKAGKVLDEDLLHTLGSSVVELFRIVDNEEWRRLTDVEKCAVGIFHRNLGEDLEIPFTTLLIPSECVVGGWDNGLHFAVELRDWTIRYEEAVAKPVPTNDQYFRVYVDSATSALPRVITNLLRKVVAFDLDDTMRVSLCLETPGPILKSVLTTVRCIRKFALRHLSLPRPSFLAVKIVDDVPNPLTGLYNFNHHNLQPWYIKPTFWKRWRPLALLMRVVGGKAPGTQGEKYYPQGYDLKTIGPKPQEGKGFDEMRSTVEFMKARGSTGCPFSHHRKD